MALFGLYSVIFLIYGVITFRTVPEEATALRQVETDASCSLDHRSPTLVLTDYILQDIRDARKDLQAHNIS